MKMVFKKETGKYEFERIDTIRNVTHWNYVLEKDKVYNIIKLDTPIGDYEYELLVNGDVSNCYNTIHLLITKSMLNEYFRFPIKDHWEIKLFSNEKMCNDFLEKLEKDYLKDIKVTENQIMVIYLVDGER